MFNENGTLIYVGKAINLKSRVSSYFNNSKKDLKTQILVNKVHDIQVIITENEVEALILEANLIKQHRPRYNIILKDDKSYPYLMLEIYNDFPRLDLHRGAKNKKAQYFGPYPNASAARKNLIFLQKIFKLRQCSDVFFKSRSRPCLQYQIDRCTAPCVQYVSQQAYHEQVTQCVQFLQGKNQDIINRLTKNMQIASQQGCYEEAAQYRDQVVRLRKLHTHQEMITDGGNTDVLACVTSGAQAVISILFIRGGLVLGHKSFHFKIPLGLSDAELLEQFIAQYYIGSKNSDNRLERIILYNKGVDKALLQQALAPQLGRHIKLIDRKHPRYESIQNTAVTNAKFLLNQKISDLTRHTQQINALQVVLGMSGPIKHIECFDISHTQGEATVGSCVVFSNEGDVRSAYRRFNIKNIQAGDDYAAMYQVIKRRYTRLIKNADPLPDLILIDGGKGQLKQADLVMKELEIKGVFLLAVAKGPERKPGKEQLFVLSQDTPIRLAEDSDALHLIQRIRDESHRFAIQAHRKKRDKKRSTSKLEHIEGVGVIKRRALLTHFGGLQELMKVSVDEMTAVKGINLKLAEKIYKALH